MRSFVDWLTSPKSMVRQLEPIFTLLGRRSDQTSSEPSEARRILVVRVEDKVGDLILSTPMLREIRRGFPLSEITLLVHPSIQPLFACCPYADRILAYPRWKPCAFGRVRRLFHEISWSFWHLWPHRFDLAIVSRSHQRTFREGVLAFLSGARWRVALQDDASAIRGNEPGEELFYTHLAGPQPEGHEVERNLSILSCLGIDSPDTRAKRWRTELWWTEEDSAYAESVFPPGQAAVTVAMMPGASVPGRRWPAERFAEIAARLTVQLGWNVVLVGGEADKPWAAAVERACASGVVNLTGRLTLNQTVAVLSRCDLYVGNDSGPMHMAAAVGVPAVEISCHPVTGAPFNERSPNRFGPWGVPSWIARPATGLDECDEFCRRGELGEAHCILAVTTEQVYEAVLQASEWLRLSPKAPRSTRDKIAAAS